MKQSKLTIFIFCTIAILLGIGIYFVNPFITLILLFVYVGAAFFSIGVILIGLFSRKFRFWYLTGFIPILVAFFFETGIRNYKHKKAIVLISQIEKFKIGTGRYPDNLLQIEHAVQLSGLKYEANSTKTSYRIEYLMDSYNREYFDSIDQTWGTLGWKD